ncbi:helix-turn-helix domain-containing protein [Actinopolymorpha alba]|uniref:helix-turn-helix domain-containing protein n=1 Tax=Actinopolymorpha alba TaxID=533267 RepID=UPI00037A4E8A|nr:helix-turn-helix domain-containing protein [Actinopolymorpha alba]
MGRAKFRETKVGTRSHAEQSLVEHGSVGQSQVEVHPSELKCWQGNGYAMRGAHRHDDIEVNLVDRAPLKYMFGGTPVEVRPGHVGLFWAAMPHRLIDCPENWNSYVCWLHIPLGTILNWGLPETVVSHLLRGRPILCATGESNRIEPADFGHWSRDLASGSDELRQVALLEIQARIRRLIHGAGLTTRLSYEWTATDDGVRHATAMAQFAATHFREPITATDVASSAHLHPNYAMTLFHQVLGTTIGAYLTQCRVAEAQRLLITTHATTSEIAAAAGFGSQSAFYATFTRICGQPPGAYRRAHHHVATTNPT